MSNLGPSDALGVVVTDTVRSALALTSVDPPIDCMASGQLVDCTFDIPVGGSVMVTVEHEAAEFLDSDGGPHCGTQEGDEFRFMFVLILISRN